MKILYITNIPAPYRVDYFNILAKHCDLTVLYEKRVSDERDKKWVSEIELNYNTIFLGGISTDKDKALSFQVIKYIKKEKYDYIVICGISSPTEILAIQWCQLRNIPYCIEGDGAFTDYSTSFKNAFKRHLIKKGRLFFSTCKEHDKYYIEYGADPDRIIRYRFSSLKEKEILDNIIDNEKKRELRAELGMPYNKVVLSVGQFIYRKGFDVLLKAATRCDSDIGFYIVGGCPTQEYLNYAKINKLTNVHFIEFKAKEELKKYFLAADVFVLPTREDIWGLVVNEAMGYGIPVITTTRCNAGTELIENAENGFLIPVDDDNELIKSIEFTLANSNKMGINALKTISSYTIENMVKDHILAFGGEYNDE
nr:glycosyltransferase family 4 protein [uncultured Blautia sp.]